MNKIFRYTLAAMAMTVCSNTLAQNLSGAYFMDGYAFGHQLNPAKEYDRKGYVAFPLVPLGNMNVALRGNLNLKDVLYPNPNGSGLVTYLHPSLSPEQALSGFSDKNTLMTDLRLDLISFGFHSKHAYQTFTLGLRTRLGVNVPYSLFDLTKNLKNQDYDISKFGMETMAWVEAGWGYSRDVTDYLRVGGKLKLLFGAGYAKARMESLKLNLSGEDQWTATAQANVEVGVKGFTWGEPEIKEYSDAYKQNHPGATTYEAVDFDNIDVESPGLGGMGVGIDLGAELDLDKLCGVSGLKVSASVLDLGFIKWKNVAVAQNKGDEFKFDGFQNIKVDDGPGTDFDDQTDDLSDRLSDLYAIQAGETKSKVTGMGATMNIGVEYTLPMYKKVNFGLLSTTRFQGDYTWNEERLAVNYHPCKWFEFGVNGAVGTLGASFGWIVNIHPSGFNLFLGGDHLLGKLSKQGIPLKSNADIALGINFPLGKSRIKR